MTADSASTPARPCVILVDDDPAVTHAMQFSFDLEGLDVRSFRDGESLLVINNFYGTPCHIELPESVIDEGMSQRLLISNYDDCPVRSNSLSLRPYESFVLHLKPER